MAGIKQRAYCIYNNITIVPKCKSCNNIVNWNPVGKFQKYCSYKCRQKNPEFKQRVKETNIKRYGTEYPSQNNNIKEKIKQTNLKKFGVDNIFKNTEFIKEKIREKLGVENPFQSEKIRKKCKQTMLERYGVENPSQANEVKNKKIQTAIKKYGVSNVNQKHLSKYCLEKLNDSVWLKEQHHKLKKPLIQIAFELCVGAPCVGTYFKKYNIKVNPYGFSYKAIQWLEAIMKEQNIFIQHARNIGEYKIPNTKITVDGFCPKTNTVYEFYGDLYHGNPQKYQSNNKTFFYKTAGELYQRTIERENMIKEMGYNLIVIWEKDWTVERYEKFYSVCGVSI